MSSYIDQKYMGLLERELTLPKRTSSSSLSARCPVCGDSARNKYKRRFGIKITSDGGVCGCFNCGYAARLSVFLKDYYPELYRAYKTEKFIESKDDYDYKPKMEQKTMTFLFTPKTKRVGLESDILKNYLVERKFPEDTWDQFTLVDNYKQYLIEMGFNDPNVDEDQRVVHIIEHDGDVLGFQGRSLDPKAQKRYINSAYDGKSLIYVPDDIDRTKPIFVHEGIPDAMMVDNSVAVMSSNLSRIREHFPTEELIFVFDKEPENHLLQVQVLKAIHNREQVYLPTCEQEYKDLNEWVINTNITRDELKDYIISHTFKHPRSLLEYKRYLRQRC